MIDGVFDSFGTENHNKNLKGLEPLVINPICLDILTQIQSKSQAHASNKEKMTGGARLTPT